MSFLARGTRAAARPLRQGGVRTQTYSQPQRRLASSHDAHHGSGESAMHVDSGAGAGSESFGKGFYLALLFVPTAYLTYSLASTSDNFVKRQYKSYRAEQATRTSQDTLHAAALEQAIHDRSEVFSEPRSATRDLRFPEMFNAGSPWNVVAGEGAADMSKLTAYYEEQKKKMEEDRIARTAVKRS